VFKEPDAGSVVTLVVQVCPSKDCEIVVLTAIQYNPFHATLDPYGTVVDPEGFDQLDPGFPFETKRPTPSFTVAIK
jgi:hypothetical protein